jgi:hypothetical protein
MMANNIKENGKIIKCMGKVNLNGQTAEFIKAVMLTIRRKALE